MSWKEQVRRLLDRTLEPVGFTLRRFRPEIRVRSMESPQVRTRQIAAFLTSMEQSLVGFPELVGELPTEPEIERFMEALPLCPVLQDGGGAGWSAGMLLWAIARSLKPELIVESGVYRGFTTWVLHQACPQARQYAFDISFAERRRLEPGMVYHESDWMDLPLYCKGQVSALIYFDDHVDQWRRIREAAARGFRYLIFDDSFPSTALHNDGLAPVPTIDMLFEDWLEDGEEVRWRTECGSFAYRYDARMAEETRRLVTNYVRLPDLRFVFGYAPANLVLVKVWQG